MSDTSTAASPSIGTLARFLHGDAPPRDMLLIKATKLRDRAAEHRSDAAEQIAGAASQEAEAAKLDALADDYEQAALKLNP